MTYPMTPLPGITCADWMTHSKHTSDVTAKKQQPPQASQCSSDQYRPIRLSHKLYTTLCTINGKKSMAFKYGLYV